MTYNIKTEAGKVLWAEINLTTGSRIWNVVGRAIEAIEAEATKAAEERIIKLLEERASDLLGHDGAECDCKVQGEECLAIVELIKGEQK